MTREITQFHQRPTRKKIPVSDIIFDPEYYPRKEVDQDRVTLFCDLMKADEYFKPIRVVLDNSRGKYIALDGEHRLSATKQLEKETIEAEIHDVFPGKWRITAAAWNFKSDKPLSHEELKHIVTLAWRKDKLAEGEIAMELGCSPQFVYSLLKDARAVFKKEQREQIKKLQEAGFSVREIAQRTGLSKSRIDQLCKPALQKEGRDSVNIADCPVFKVTLKTGPREIPAKDKESLVVPSSASSTGGPTHTDINAELSQESDEPESQPDPEAATKAEAEAERNAKLIELALCNQPKTSDDLSIDWGLNRPGNSFRGLGIENPMPPRPSIDLTLPEQDVKEQISKIYPTATNQMGSYELCTDADKKALRIMELVKFFKQDIDVIKIDTGESEKFIFKVMIAAFILATSPEINDEYTAEIAARLDMPPDLAETIDDYGIRGYKIVLHPVAPHMSAWIDKNFPSEALSLVLKVSGMNEMEFKKLIDGKPAPVLLKQDFPREKVESLKLGVSYFRQYRDMIRTRSFSSHSLVFPQKCVEEIQIILKEIADITKKLYIGNKLKIDLKED